MKKLENIEEFKNFIKENQIVILNITLKSCNVCISLKEKTEIIANKIGGIEIAEIIMEELLLIRGELQVFTPVIIVFVEAKEVFRKGKFLVLEELKECLENYKSVIS